MESESQRTLRELVLLALGTPEIGAVNFNILQSLLLSMLDHLNLLDSKASAFFSYDEPPNPVPFSPAASFISVEKSSSLEHLDKKVSKIENQLTALNSLPSKSLSLEHLDKKVSKIENQITALNSLPNKSSSLEHLDKKVSKIENQLTALNSLPSNFDIIQGTKSGTVPSPVADMWQHMQLHKKVESNEDGVTRALSFVDDVLKEFQDFRHEQKRHDEQLAALKEHVVEGGNMSKIESRLNGLEEHSRSLKQMEAELTELAVKLAEYPDASEFETYVTWPVLEEALMQNVKQIEKLKEVQNAMIESPPESGVLPAKQQYLKCDLSGKPLNNDSIVLPLKNDSNTLSQGSYFTTVPIRIGANAPLKNDSREELPTQQWLPDNFSKELLNVDSGVSWPAETNLNVVQWKGEPKIMLPENISKNVLLKDNSASLASTDGSEDKLSDMQLSPSRQSAKSGSIQTAPVEDFCELSLKDSDSIRLSLQGSEKELLQKRSSASTRLSSAMERFPHVTDMLARIGELNKKYSILEEYIYTIQDILPRKADISDLKGSAALPPRSEIPDDTLEQINGMRETIENLEKSLSQMKDTARMQQNCIDNILSFKGGSSAFSDGESSGYESASGASASDMKKMEIVCERLAQKISTNFKELTQADAILQNAIDQERHSVTDVSNQLEDLKNKNAEFAERIYDLCETVQELHQLIKDQKHSSIVISEPRVESRYALQMQESKTQPPARPQDPLPMLRPRSLKKTVMSQESEDISGIQTSLLNLEGEMEKLACLIDSALEEHKVKQKHIDTLYVHTEKLKEKKADRHNVKMEMDLKADKVMLHTKVSRSDIDSMTSEITRSLDDLLEKMLGQDANWQKSMKKLSADVDGKMDRLELESLKQHLENRMKAMKKLIEKHQSQDLYAEGDEAAGFRKQLLQNYNCISCDRPVEIAAPGAFPSIPASGGLPTSKSVRPYTSYELDQIRQQAKGNLLVGRNTTNFRAALEEREIARLRKLDELCYKIHYPHGDPQFTRRQETEDMEYIVQSGRSCGGGYTLTYPHRRYTRLTHLSELWQDEEEASVPKEEVELQGHDGHIYKGRLPVLQRPQQTQNTPDSGFSTAREKKEVPSRPNSAESPARPYSGGRRTPASSDRPLTGGRSTSHATVGTQDVQKSMEQFASFTTTSN